LLYQF